MEIRQPSRAELDEILGLLRAIKHFPARPDTRHNVKHHPDDRYYHFCLGSVRRLRDTVPSVFNARFPELHDAVQRLCDNACPAHRWNCCQVNKNYECAEHVDKHNDGPSVMIALGEYTGGRLRLTETGEELDAKDRFVHFDGRRPHMTTPFEGERFTLVFFPTCIHHGTRPPSLRG